MAKVPILSMEGKAISEIELPAQFNEPVRADLIKRAALAVMSSQHQAYGTDPLAGKRQGKAWPKRRRKFGSTYGRGISRVARKYRWRRGEQFGWVGARGGQTVKGMKSFPPKVERIFKEKINKKENRKAIRSALAATAIPELVARNHKINEIKILPIVLEDKCESIQKTREVYRLLKALGLKEELARTKPKKIRAGKGKMRGRRYKVRCGPLIVVSKPCNLQKAAANLVGIDIVPVKSLNAALLAPGAQPARLTLWTKPALDILEKEKLWQ
ncbi:MAG: 50S ribosomal protein L4 [Candidatus Nanoarchaeia archaeon]